MHFAACALCCLSAAPPVTRSPPLRTPLGALLREHTLAPCSILHPELLCSLANQPSNEDRRGARCRTLSVAACQPPTAQESPSHPSMQFYFPYEGKAAVRSNGCSFKRTVLPMSTDSSTSPCLPWGHLLTIPLFQTAEEGVVAGLVAVSTVHPHQGMPSCCLLRDQPGTHD